jgi:hypothetical protein
MLQVQEKTDIESILDYIIERNPEGVKKVLLLNGYNRFSTIRDMQISLLDWIRQDCQKAIPQILSEHPDYHLIVADYQEKNPIVPQVITPKKKKADPKQTQRLALSHIPSLQVDFSVMINLLMFLVCVWIVLKIFKDL